MRPEKLGHMHEELMDCQVDHWQSAARRAEEEDYDHDRLQHMREIINELSDRESYLEDRIRRTDGRKDAMAKAAIAVLLAVDAGRLPSLEQVKALRELCA